MSYDKVIISIKITMQLSIFTVYIYTCVLYHYLLILSFTSMVLGTLPVTFNWRLNTRRWWKMECIFDVLKNYGVHLCTSNYIGQAGLSSNVDSRLFTWIYTPLPWPAFNSKNALFDTHLYLGEKVSNCVYNMYMNMSPYSSVKTSLKAFLVIWL